MKRKESAFFVSGALTGVGRKKAAFLASDRIINFAVIL